MAQSENNPIIPSDDFNLKEILHKTGEYFAVLWAGKWWIIALAVLGAGGMYLRDTLKPIKYEARLTFSLNEGDGPSTGALSGLLGQIGLSSGNSGKVSLDKIVELSKSMRIVNKALFEKAEVDGKSDFIANHIIEIYKLDKTWAKYNPEMKGFRLKSDKIDSFNLSEKSVLKGIYGLTIGGLEPGLMTCTYDNKSTIFNLSATTLSEPLSIALSEQLFFHLSKFYIQQSNDKQKQTYDLVKYKTDSLYRAWTSAEYSVSSADQSSNALWSPVDRTGKSIQQKRAAIISLAYGEALKNLEMADYALKNATPFIREIDRPFSPLNAIMPNKVKNMIIGFILGLVLASAYFLAKYFIKLALKS